MGDDKDRTADIATQSTTNEESMLSSIDTAEFGTGDDAKDQQEEGDEGGLDEQAQAFNPETGEINWDCPCLGGMAHGTCGEEFKAAFSCFVYSKEEPKGMDCIEAFKGMQECFRAHPEEYSDEIDTEDDEYDAADIKESNEPGDGEDIDSNHTQTSESSTRI
ncbi:Oxidoreductase [Coemansia guatemalensis]|uniref:Mitochondrial intermembrane space import and assembly protein 40 n=1 Tax=Coemansia guatemalensis TaxID=2761395 RepID=A0A9W8LTR3_9FUNG|nr:Oxidoreductase [Coemansia guatemalensis]